MSGRGRVKAIEMILMLSAKSADHVQLHLLERTYNEDDCFESSIIRKEGFERTKELLKKVDLGQWRRSGLSSPRSNLHLFHPLHFSIFLTTYGSEYRSSGSFVLA